MGAPICEDVKRATKAIDVWDKFYNLLDIYGREDVPPPCEFFIPTVKEQTAVIKEKRGEYTTMQADLRFKSQVCKGTILIKPVCVSRFILD